jgi:DNA-binding MarR family transcriptional regulator
MSETVGDPLLFRFFNEMGIIDQLASSLFEQTLPGDLKLSQFVVLNHFARLGGVRSPAELAQAFQVSKGAMTNTLQRLEAGRLVKIIPDPADGRAKLVSITHRGEQLRHQAITGIAPVLKTLEEELGAEQFQQALPFLQALRITLDKARHPE